MKGKISKVKFNGQSIPLASLRVRYNTGPIDLAIDCGESYADIVASELRAVDREVKMRSVPRVKYTAGR